MTDSEILTIIGAFAGVGIATPEKASDLNGGEVAGLIRVLARERDEARDWVRRIHNDTQVLTCAFCGTAYPPGTPSANDETLRAHVMVCEKHPLRARLAEVESERNAARAEAAGLRGALLPFVRAYHCAKRKRAFSGPFSQHFMDQISMKNLVDAAQAIPEEKGKP